MQPVGFGIRDVVFVHSWTPILGMNSEGGHSSSPVHPLCTNPPVKGTLWVATPSGQFEFDDVGLLAVALQLQQALQTAFVREVRSEVFFLDYGARFFFEPCNERVRAGVEDSGNIDLCDGTWDFRSLCKYVDELVVQLCDNLAVNVPQLFDNKLLVDSVPCLAEAWFKFNLPDSARKLLW